MTFLKMLVYKFKEWLNSSNEPKYLSGKTEQLNMPVIDKGIYLVKIRRR